MKTCYLCGCHKELNEFYKNKSRKDGFQTHCKECNKILIRERYKKNPEYYLNKNAVSRLENSIYVKELLKDRKCTYCQENDPVVLSFFNLEHKTFSVSAMVHKCNSVAAIKRETDNCEVICLNCYKKLYNPG